MRKGGRARQEGKAVVAEAGPSDLLTCLFLMRGYVTVRQWRWTQPLEGIGTYFRAVMRGFHTTSIYR